MPKKKKKSWNPENLKAALEAIRNGSKIKAAARNFSIPESTIRDRLKMRENYDQWGERPHLHKKNRKKWSARYYRTSLTIPRL